MGINRISTINLEENKPAKRSVDINLSVFQYAWRWNTWHGFWHNIADFFHNIRAGWHRATKGYCVRDVWDCGDNIVDYTIKMLVHYRNYTYCYPDRDFSTFEEWIAYIDSIIDMLLFARGNADEELNSYYSQYQEFANTPRTEWTEEENAIFKNYIEETTTIYNAQKEAHAKAFAMLGKYIQASWW